MYTFIYIYIYIHIYIYIYTHMQISFGMVCFCMYACVNLCIYIDIYIYICAYVHNLHSAEPKRLKQNSWSALPGVYSERHGRGPGVPCHFMSMRAKVNRHSNSSKPVFGCR